MQTESEALQEQIEMSKESIKNLETILHSSRDKEFQSQMAAQVRRISDDSLNH